MIITTVTMEYNSATDVYILDPEDANALNQFVNDNKWGSPQNATLTCELGLSHLPVDSIQCFWRSIVLQNNGKTPLLIVSWMWYSCHVLDKVPFVPGSSVMWFLHMKNWCRYVDRVVLYEAECARMGQWLAIGSGSCTFFSLSCL